MKLRNHFGMMRGWKNVMIEEESTSLATQPSSKWIFSFRLATSDTFAQIVLFNIHRLKVFCFLTLFERIGLTNSRSMYVYKFFLGHVIQEYPQRLFRPSPCCLPNSWLCSHKALIFWIVFSKRLRNCRLLYELGRFYCLKWLLSYNVAVLKPNCIEFENRIWFTFPFLAYYIHKQSFLDHLSSLGERSTHVILFCCLSVTWLLSSFYFI